MQPGPDPSRRLHVVVKHPMPLLASGIVWALAREGDIDATPWAGPPGVDALLLADYETVMQLAAGRHPGRRLAVIGTNGREAEVRSALEAGVGGYLFGMCSVAELVACVRALAAGRRYLSEGVLRCVADSFCHDTLTPRETAVLQALWEGLSNKAIALRLHIGIGTVKGHVRAILDKLDAGNRTQAVKVALSRGLIDEAGSHRPGAASPHAPRAEPGYLR